ncbi:hypothetical protein H8M03_12435 [Sphingomonas sabuli]|uniref:Uncharacterized protein n=1 Tax=Sphingomonas sabuli TaxID=2764186 RepID=A0A7G9L2C4_9SPHN|nr:hypothetical protein [Sphingomonas sabuli]QNM82773.1 hypothetical protein H8M03_12435 [Sphingomonas sabuli]
MLTFIRFAAVAASLLLLPLGSFGPSPDAIVATAEQAASPVTKLAPQARRAVAAFGAEFGLAAANAHVPESGLAVGQTADDFRDWLRASPAHRAELSRFRSYLAAQGVEAVVPMWQLVRTSSSWKECAAEPFETPPADKWDHIVKTLQFVRDNVVPAVGQVEPLSAYRNEGLNSCSNGAPKSAHRHFFALDLTPLDTKVARADMIRSVCAAHAREGQAYDTGLGFYSGRRFHVDSSGYRKWGPNGKGATSPCVGQA